MENGGSEYTAGGARERKISKRWHEGEHKLERRTAKERERERKEKRSCCSAAFGSVTG